MSRSTGLMVAAVTGLFIIGSMLTGMPDATAQPADSPPTPSMPLDAPLDPSTAAGSSAAPPGSRGRVTGQEKLANAKTDSANDTDMFDGDISNKVVKVNGAERQVAPEQAELVQAYFSRQISFTQLSIADPALALLIQNGALELVDAEEFGPRTNTSSPSETTDPTSPIGRANSLSAITSAVDSCQYLTFCRWKSVNAVPSADVSLTSMSQAPLAVAATFSSFVFTIAGLIFYVMGVGLILIVSVDILSNAIYLIDFLFGAITTQILGMDGNPSGALGMIIVIAIATVGIKVLIPGRVMSLNLGLKSLTVTFISIGILAAMAYQSTKNHPSLAGDGVETSAVADMAEYSGADDKIGSLPAESEYASPKDWAPFSPGWLVSSAASLASHVGGVVNEATDKVADSVNSTFSKSGLSSCDVYSAGMRAAFLKTAAAEKMGGQANVLVSFDRLVGSLYFRNFQLASFGNSQGAENAWCRIAETQAKIAPADQIMLARVSGLYKEIVGVGSMGVIKESNSAIVNPLHVSVNSGIAVTPTGGTFLNANGTWTNPRTSTAGEGQTVEDSSILCSARDSANLAVSVITLGQADVSCDDLEVNATHQNQAGSIGTSGANAMNIFGYAFRSQEASREFSSYWAACNWISKGDGVGVLKLNPEWENVKQANSEDNLRIENCTEPLIIDNADKQGFGMASADGADVAKPVQVWDYTEKAEDDSNELWSVVSSFLGVGGSSSAIGKFSGAMQDDGTNRALDYYMFTTGANNIQGSLFAVVSGAMALLTAKYFTPLVSGALFAQALAVAGLTLLALLMFLLIFPSDRTRKMMRAALKTIATALLSSSILAAFFGLAFALTTLFTNLLWNNMPQAILMQAIISGLGAFLAFKLLNVGLKKAMGNQMDMTSWSSGISAGMGAAAPAFQYLGFQDMMSPMDRNFWTSERTDQDDTHPEILSDHNTQTSSGGDEDPVSDKHRRHSDLRSLTSGSKEGRFAEGTESVDAAAAAQGGLDPANDAAAAVMTGVAAASTARHKAEAVATGFAKDAEHIITSPIKEGMEVAHDLKNRGKAEMDPTVAATLMDNTVPFHPNLRRDAFSRAGIVMPTAENYDEYIKRLPGVRSVSVQRDPGAAENMFDSQTLSSIAGQNMPSVDGSPNLPTTTNPIANTAMSAWVANANGLIQLNQMAAIESVTQSQKASVDDLRQWGAESGLLDTANFSAAPVTTNPTSALVRNRSRILDIVMTAMSNADRSLTQSVDQATEQRSYALADLFASASMNPAPDQISAATWKTFNEVRSSFIDSIARSNANTNQVIENWGSAQAQQFSAAIENLNDELRRVVQSAVHSSAGQSEAQVRASFDSVISRIRGLHG